MFSIMINRLSGSYEFGIFTKRMPGVGIAANIREIAASDGYYRIIGRIDDVINIAGHRLGTKEIENASLKSEEVAEAAVVAAKDELKGEMPDLCVALKPEYKSSKKIMNKISDSVAEDIGKIARPKNIYIVPDMPKTRSVKIMRRVLAAISNKEDVGDVRTLANPDIVEEIRKIVQRR
jgi:acetyl-CoA synthetase